MNQDPQQPKINIFVAEDHPFARLGMITQLSSYEDFEILPRNLSRDDILNLPEDIHSTLTLIRDNKPDVVVMDIKWGNDNYAGIEATIQIKHDLPGCKVVLYSNYDSRDLVERAIQEANVDGYVLKGQSSELPKAIRNVFSGVNYFASEVVNHMLSIIRKIDPAFPNIDTSFDNNDVAILKLLAQGKTNQRIAQELGYTGATIKRKTHLLYEKLDVYKGRPKGSISPRVVAIREGLQQGLLKFSDLIQDEEDATKNDNETS